MEQTLCQACRSASVETAIESDEPQRPFQVCRGCVHRLETLSLRPLEWFNLASIHGPYHFLLHDDFYDEEGAACQPEEDVVDAESHPAPTLEAVADDVERLLDYARARWFVDGPVVDALNRHRRDSVLRSLRRRVAADPTLEVKSFAYEICARVLGRVAEEWIREQWESFEQALLFPLAEASAACLPLEEGYGLVVGALAEVSQDKLVRASGALSWFRSEATLDWLERNVSDPLVEDWGRLAAVSRLKWERVAKWLASGRPLSLVALDALKACWNYNTPLLRQFAPKLLEPAPFDEMNDAVNQYLGRDSAPRVRKAVEAVTDKWEQICISQRSN